MSVDALPTILLVDDEEHSLAAMRLALEDDFDCLTATNAEDATQLMEEHFVQVIFCDQRMPGKSGVEFLTEARDRWPDTVRIIITGYTETNDIIAAINDAGIYQFLTKPWHPDHLLMSAKNAADLFRLTREHDQLALEMRFLSRNMESKVEEQRKALREGLGFEKVLRAPNSPMNSVVAQARQFASFDVSVMIIGEPGTQKSALARAMHYSSLRSDRAFFEVNCSGVDDDLLEIELFGAKRGAVPGRPTQKMGVLRKADKGTVFLRGVTDLSQHMQRAIARFATEGVFRPVGGGELENSDVRLLASAPDDIAHQVAEGRFRSDLFYALSKTTVATPPLRARKDDLAILAQNFLFDAAAEHGKPVHGLSDDAVRFLERYDWPGNLRELENEMVRILIFSQDSILGPELISRHILQASPSDSGRDSGTDQVLMSEGTLKERVEQIEMRILRETLTRLKWNKSRAATELGLSRVGLRAKIERYGIVEPGKVGQRHTEEE
ncbi:sigma-54-dependent Fis family transcriptional regulator [Tropicibacter sp. R15_0]|uniref:sigma-54-dependent transcriptional regulator n=1 Tax=Tropicibacter sp. R15_0 TaxID=2821101 RepID=UPI001ADD58A1|nr:sigma-54 dependent transcriptional regulator [Tropicibacter sp. R15_0]MBO9467337.1 sigma-54-dependent Fis family transcriptional regulator [Tropicibacter sp. R15_0]